MEKNNTDNRRAIVIVLDSAGVGYLPDAGEFGDVGADTFGHIIEKRGLNVPNLAALGLYDIPETSFVNKNPASNSKIIGCYGKAAEITKAKDTTCGHWELMGHPVDPPFRTFPNGFPKEFIAEYERKIGRGVLGNCAESGTEIIKRLGDEMCSTGKPIVYTSADSVFQIAAHEDIISIEEQYRFCKIAREMLVGDMAVGRVIARPFKGEKNNYSRTERRKDFALPPQNDTVLDALKSQGHEVLGIGKIEDIFCNRGLTKVEHTTNNHDGTIATIDAIREQKDGLIFTNLVDTDMLYGHRNDIDGYAEALEEFDRNMPEILGSLRSGDLLIITADHGCDPAFPGTDHTREYIPILAYSPGAKQNICLGIRDSFADIGASVYMHLTRSAWHCAKSFRDLMI